MKFNLNFFLMSSAAEHSDDFDWRGLSVTAHFCCFNFYRLTAHSEPLSINFNLNCVRKKFILKSELDQKWTVLVWNLFRSQIARTQKTMHRFSSPYLHLNSAFVEKKIIRHGWTQWFEWNATHSFRFSASIFMKHTAHRTHIYTHTRTYMWRHQMLTLLRVYVSLTLHFPMLKRFTCDAHDESICRLPRLGHKLQPKRNDHLCSCKEEQTPKVILLLSKERRTEMWIHLQHSSGTKRCIWYRIKPQASSRS